MTVPVGDRFLYWPAVTSLIAVTLMVLACGIPGPLSFLMIVAVLSLASFAAIAILTVFCLLAIRKYFRTSASVLFALIVPVLLLPQINWVADCIHLGASVWFGAWSLGNCTLNGRGNPAYDWSVGFAGGPGRFVVHDVTDKVGLPVRHPIDPEHANGFEEACAGRSRHLLGHYYICTLE